MAIGPVSALIFGFHPVREALRHRPHQVRVVWIGRRRSGRRRQEIEAICRRHRVDLRLVPESELDRRVDGVHNGFVAEVEATVVRPGTAAADPDLVVLLEDVQDPRNLGAVLRSCEATGVGRVLIRDRGSSPISAAAVKAAAGATEWLEVERVVNSAAAIQRLKDEGFWVYGTAAGGTPPWRIDLSGKVALCFGGEGAGLRARTRQLCDDLIGLPMRGKVGSLNVSAAVTAVLYEALRQRDRDDPLPADRTSGYTLEPDRGAGDASDS